MNHTKINTVEVLENIHGKYKGQLCIVPCSLLQVDFRHCPLHIDTGTFAAMYFVLCLKYILNVIWLILYV